MKLLIDIGNTATKFAYSTNNSFRFLNRIYNKDISEENINNIFKDIKIVESIYISSVAPKIKNQVSQILIKKYEVEPISLSTDLKDNVKIEIDNREELGIDLYCDLVAAYQEYGPKTVIIDFGTATKILFINDKGVFNSCAIFLGYEKSKNILANSTELLPKVENKKIKPISECRNTVDVIDSSAYYSQLFTVNGIIEEYEKEVGYTLKRVFTGGNAKDFIDTLGRDKYDEHLLFKGLLILSERKE